MDRDQRDIDRPANVDDNADDTADVKMTTSGDPLADGVFEFLVRKKAIIMI